MIQKCIIDLRQLWAGFVSDDGQEARGQGVQAIARAAAILRALGPAPMSLGEIARETGLPLEASDYDGFAKAFEEFVSLHGHLW